MCVENKYTLLYNVIILYIIKNKINLMLSQSVNLYLGVYVENTVL